MAPMAGVTDAAYRIMCRRRGAEMAYTEMVSVAGLSYKSAKTWVLVEPEPEEPQICVQLFGTKPEQFAFAVNAVQERVGDKLTLIDINMACPARKVITKGEGSALMKEPELAASLVEACVREACVPVTVKIRRGFAAGENTAADAVFIARGTYGNPWVFGDARALALDGALVPERGALERIEALREHLTLLHETQPFMARGRAFSSWYLKGLPHAAAWRGRVVQCTTYEEFMALLDEAETEIIEQSRADSDAGSPANPQGFGI